ncbi:unnamed protein product [Absidia cylindrospora]
MNFNWTKTFVVKEDTSLNDGDKLVLPSSALQDLLDLSKGTDLSSPMTFALRHPHYPHKVLHGGVKEFSGDDDTASVPTWIMSSLGFTTSSEQQQQQQQQRIVVQWKVLAKGTWTKLQPLTNNYQEIMDYRAALESHLRQHYNTLTIGQTLTCRYGSQRYPFLVVDLKPDQAVGVNDTDLEVDLEPYQSTNILTTSDTSALIASSSSSSSSSDSPATTTLSHPSTSSTEQIPQVHLDQHIEDVSVSRNEYRYWSLNLEKWSQFTITLKTNLGEADLVVGLDRRPTIDNYLWGDLSSGGERHLEVDTAKGNKGVIYVGVHAYSDCVVSWTASATDMTSIGNDTAMEEDTTGKTQCGNCQAWVPERTLPLHENFCLRNNVICPWGCGKIFKTNDGGDTTQQQLHWHCDQCDTNGDSLNGKAKHMDYFHTKHFCDQCDEHTVVPSLLALAEHRQTTCSGRLITCRYCHNLIAQGPISTDARDRLLGLHGHESYCGSRTITCQKCQKSITIKDVPVHAKIHQVTRQNQKLPPLCNNQQCTRPKTNNRLGLCQYCFGPFWVTEDDPKNVKLVQRVVRKLHGQMTIGCGHSWCQNKYCATGSKSPQDANMAASTLIPIIKKLTVQLAMPTPRPVLNLCVGAKVTRIRFLAETLFTSSDGAYGLDWCIKALESEEEDLDRSKSWLDRNAPQKSIK